MEDVTVQKQKFSKKHSELHLVEICNFSKNLSRKVSFIRNNYKNFDTIYLIEFENGTKFGITCDIANRLRQYLSPWNLPIKKITLISTKKGHSYFSNIETQLVRDFTHKHRTNGSREFISSSTSGWLKVNILKRFRKLIKKDTRNYLPFWFER